MKKFTLLQLFSIVDGRLSTSIGDVYEMLNHITGEDLMTHHLPVAMDFIKLQNPEWLKTLTIEIDAIKKLCGNDFETLMGVIKENNSVHEIPTLTQQEKTGFEQWMIDNSLLKKVGSKI